MISDESCNENDINEFQIFMNAQIEQINIHKYLESEKAHRDLGNEAVMDWIIKYAKIFREQYDKNRKNGKS